MVTDGCQVTGYFSICDNGAVGANWQIAFVWFSSVNEEHFTTELYTNRLRSFPFVPIVRIVRVLWRNMIIYQWYYWLESFDETYLFVHIGHVWKQFFGWHHCNLDETKTKKNYLGINSVWPRYIRRNDQWGISRELHKEFWQYFNVSYPRRLVDEHFLSRFWRGIHSKLQVSDTNASIELIRYIYPICSFASCNGITLLVRFYLFWIYAFGLDLLGFKCQMQS